MKLVAAILLVAATTVNADDRAPRDPHFVSVLFIGNSLTYYNEIPLMTASIASRQPRPMRIDLAVRAGASLKQLWEETDARRRIWRAHWDYVIIQGGAGAAGPLKNLDDFNEYLARFASEARRSGAEPLFYMVWSLTAPAEHEAASIASAKRIRARIIPVGSAWYELLGRQRFARLDWDGVHPNVFGAYLAACTMFATIYDRSPVGAPFDFRKLAVPDAIADEALRQQELTADDARAIQEAAWDAVQRSKKR